MTTGAGSSRSTGWPYPDALWLSGWAVPLEPATVGEADTQHLICSDSDSRRVETRPRSMSDAVHGRGGLQDRELRQLDPDQLSSHVARLYRAAYGLCGSRQDAEDLVQDTYEQILRRPRFLRGDQDLAYLLRVLRNTWIRSARKQRPVATVTDVVEIEAVADPRGDTLTGAIEARVVYDALGRLSPHLREAVVAVDVLGLSYKDAARALRTKEGTIMSRLHRGRGQIASQLEGG